MSPQNRSRLSVLLGIAALGVWLVLVFSQPPVATAAQQQPRFVGPAPARQDSSDLQAFRLRFEAGARSGWHSHVGWQIMAADEGRGRSQVRGGPIEYMVPAGQPIYAGPGVVHWHGADPDEYIVQLTIMGGSDLRGLEQVTQYEAVSDDDYLGR